MFRSIQKMVAVVVVATVLVGVSSTANAGNCHSSYQPAACYYKTVTVWESVRKPCVHYVTKYDHCGQPYRARVTVWKTVRVPVTKRVKVCR